MNDEGVILYNLRCVDAEGRVFEQYDRLFVPFEIEKNNQGYKHPQASAKHPERLHCFTLDGALKRAEEISKRQGETIFIPSSALTWNILAKLAAQRDNDPRARMILDNYSDNGVLEFMEGTSLNTGSFYRVLSGLHQQGTSVNLAERTLTHYTPQGQVELPFDIPETKNDPFTSGAVSLEQALADPKMRKLVQQITGLEDLRVIKEIAERLWFNAVFTNPYDNSRSFVEDPIKSVAVGRYNSGYHPEREPKLVQTMVVNKERADPLRLGKKGRG